MTDSLSLQGNFSSTAPNAMVSKLCLFLSELRGTGFNIGVGEARDAVTLAVDEGSFSRPLFQKSLKHLLCSQYDEWQQFDELFAAFFGLPIELQGKGSTPNNNDRFEKQFKTEMQIVADFYEGHEGDKEAGAGREVAISKTDFRFLTEQAGWEEAALAAEQLARQIKMRPTRRWRKSASGKRIDLASTARRLAATDGDPLYIGYKKRKRRPMRIVALLDVSHSMSYYSPMLARFIRGLVLNFDNCEAFSFHVELNHITDILKKKDLEVMRRRMEAFENLWFGGTNIATSLHKFNQHYLPDLASSNTVVLIFSDGCDTTAVDEMIPPFEHMARAVRRIYWINPMKARLDKAQLISSSPLMAAKSYIDGQICGDSLRSLEALARVLSR